MSFQKLILCGEIVNDPELRYTQSGIPCCAFKLKTVDIWAGSDGQARTEEEVHKVIVWRQDGERAAKELKKGGMVLVEGKNKTRMWMAENGVEIPITEVVAVPNGVKPLAGGLVQQPSARSTKARENSTKNPAPQPASLPAPKAAPQPAPAQPVKAPKDSPIKPMTAAEKVEKAEREDKPEKVSVDLLSPEVVEDLPF